MKVDLKRLIETDLPQKIAYSIFHWCDTKIIEWNSLLVENYLPKNYITVNWWSCDRHLLKFRIFEDGEIFAGIYNKPEESDEWILVQTCPVSREYILLNILNKYLL